MTNFPVSLDDDSTLPIVNNNIDEIGGDAINAVRDATIALETNVGIGAAGSTSSLAFRLGVSVNPDGTLKTSALTSLGLVTLPITQNQIANNAGIPESKLMLDHRTQDLFNYIQNLSGDVNTALGWISTSGVKLEAHLIGALYRHTLDQIDVSVDLVNFPFLNNKFRVARNNTNAYFVINDINNELLAHQWADGSAFTVPQNVVTNNGSTYPSTYAHTASGIFLNTSRFAVIPQTAQDVQAFADFIDGASILTLGTRIQNLYHSGISRNSRSSSLTADGYGQALVPVTPAIAYLRGNGNNSIPIDDIAIGEDIIQFMPSATVTSNNSFDEQFALVRPGDIIRVNYGDGYNIEVPFVISEKKYIQGGGNKIFIVRVAGKNVAYSPNCTARIDRPLFNQNKYGVLAVAGVDSPTVTLPSLIVANPRGAQCLGVNFSPDQFNETHYLLYLALFTTGNPLDGYTILPGIDVTGDLGKSPGSYTLNSVVNATNSAFRKAGFNYRFIAFQNDGEFGLALADSINNVSFSVISAVVSGAGNYNQPITQLNFPNNVVDVFPSTGLIAPDPLGFGPANANVASPPFQKTYGSPQAASFPTYLFPPLRRNNYYVNGAERELLNLDIEQVLDTYGDGFWTATIDGYTDNPGPPGHVTVTYKIPLDLSASKLKAGKTIVVQQSGSNLGLVNYGRFIIQSITFSCCPPIQTEITVYDGVHGTGVSPSLIAPIGSQVAIYLSASSVSFNAETATDFTAVSAAFKRHFEVYVDEDGNTFTHERGRISINGNVTVNGVTIFSSIPQLGQLDIVRISPKLRGYQFGPVNKITLDMTSFDSTTGLFTGNLASYDGVIFTKQGPVTSGKVGEIIRFYDESNIDYIDVIFEFGNTIPTFSNQYIDFQLFPTLSLDQEIMLLASCQERSDTNTVSQILDLRTFGNTSEEEFTTSALDFISLGERLLHFNGVIRGFDATVAGAYANDGLLTLKGGLALVNGNFEDTNQQIFTVPPLQEIFTAIAYPINYALCVMDGGDLVTIVLTDFDPILVTPNAPNRIVTVKNAVSGTTYQIDSNTFSNILNNRKDLTILYIVSATVTGSGSSAATTLTIRDVRRFVNDSDSNIPAVLTSDNSQGNFKTLSAALNWLKFNSAFQDELEVKGAFAISSDPGLNFPLNIVGQGSTATLVFNSVMNMSNVTFTGINVTFNGALTATNVTFNNCTITFNGATTFTNVIIDPSVVNVNATITNSGVAIFRDTTVNVTVARGFAIGSGLKFTNCTFNYSYNPVGGSPTYSSADLVNAGSGMMYSNVTGSLIGLTITDCTFNNTLADHFPFISLQLGGTGGSFSYSAYVQSVHISGNKFNNLFVGNDRRSVIAITSTITTAPPSSSYPAFPKLVDVIISNNICNYDQMILLSTVRAPGVPITGALLSCVDCEIRDNVCGVIGYMTASDVISAGDNSEVANLGSIRDKIDQLVIQKNTCKLITNLDSVGQYIVFKATETTNIDWVKVGTGAATIEKNAASWILVGAAAWSQNTSIYTNLNGEGVIIKNNRVSAGNPTFLNAYVDTANSGITPPNIGILLRYDGYQQSDFLTTQSIIGNNLIDSRTWLESVGFVYNVFNHTIQLKCENSANIHNNTLDHPGRSSVMVFLGGAAGATGGPIIRFTGNILSRGNTLIAAYIQSGNSNSTNNVVVTNNTFDSPTIDGTSINLALNFPRSWVYHTNVNQTAYLSVSATDHANYASSTGFPNANTASGAVPAGSGFISAGPTNNGALLLDTSAKFLAGRVVPFINFFPPPSFGPTASYMQVSDYDGSGTIALRDYSFSVPIDTSLPIGAKIISATVGVYVVKNGASTLDISAGTNNQYTLSLIPYGPTSSANSTQGVADVAANLKFFAQVSDFSIDFTGFLQSTFFVGSSITATQTTVAALTTATQYTTITPAQTAPVQQQLTVDGLHKIAVCFDLNYKRSGGSGASDVLTWYISPVVVQYRW